jgi:antitoxin CcdA
MEEAASLRRMRLEQYKAREGLSLTALAARIGRPVSTVHGWLSGARRPDWAGLEAIAAATGGSVTAADFLAGGGAPPGGAAARDRPGDPAEMATPDRASGSAGREGFAERQAPFAAEARALGLDPDAIAAQALAGAIRAEKTRRWQEENRAAIEAWNRWTEENELPLARYRMF